MTKPTQEERARAHRLLSVIPMRNDTAQAKYVGTSWGILVGTRATVKRSHYSGLIYACSEDIKKYCKCTWKLFPAKDWELIK